MKATDTYSEDQVVAVKSDAAGAVEDDKDKAAVKSNKNGAKAADCEV